MISAVALILYLASVTVLFGAVFCEFKRPMP
jgi:hypothetical protein